MKTISAKIQNSDAEKLAELAKSVEGGVSAVVREAVHEYCNKAAADKTKRNAAFREAFGAFKSAPLDAREHRRKLSERVI
ncbi:hypothetical protein P4C99_12750 [Pontiellaceae bacterium B1224]|nr:hypothetical protein [Pontiellaceae bacterium B1224]